MAKFILINGIRIASEFTPETFGRLTSIGPAFRAGESHKKQVFECVCGNVIVACATDIKRGRGMTCACYRREKAAERSRKISAFGKSLTIAEWSKETGISDYTIRRRLSDGLSAELSVSIRVPDRSTTSSAESKAEARAFAENPFTFKLSSEKASRRAFYYRSPRIVSACCFCGSEKILGSAQSASFRRNGRSFCDQECASEWKSYYYRSSSYTNAGFEKSIRKKRRRLLISSCVEHNESVSKIRECKCCLRMFSSDDAFCSSACRIEFMRKESRIKKLGEAISCIECGKKFAPRFWQKSPSYCSDKCSKRSHRRKKRHVRRTIEKEGERIAIAILAEKHGWQCRACGVSCSIPTSIYDPCSATIDHVVPVSKGGSHTWDNVQILCHLCNSKKSDNTMEEFIRNMNGNLYENQLGTKAK